MPPKKKKAARNANKSTKSMSNSFANNKSNNKSMANSFANNKSNNKSMSNSFANQSNLTASAVPSDDDLYDAGWAKHYDPNRRAYYYYHIDGTAGTTWENPLLNSGSQLEDPHQASSFGEQSLTMSGLFRTNPVVGDMGSSFSSNANNNQNASSFKGNQSQQQPAAAQSLAKKKNSKNASKRALSNSFANNASKKNMSNMSNSLANSNLTNQESSKLAPKKKNSKNASKQSMSNSFANNASKKNMSNMSTSFANKSNLTNHLSDDDLYDAGWAKAWDANRKAYYYYSIDGTAATTWENPLLDYGPQFTDSEHFADVNYGDKSGTGSSVADDPHQSSFFGEQSLTMSGLFRTNPVVSDMGSSFSSNANNNQNASSFKGNQSQQQPAAAQSLAKKKNSKNASKRALSNSFANNASRKNMSNMSNSLANSNLTNQEPSKLAPKKKNSKNASKKSMSNSFANNASKSKNNMSNMSNSFANKSNLTTVLSDDDLYDAGWAKAWDANRSAYYYYSIDGTAATTWENPLLDYGPQFTDSEHFAHVNYDDESGTGSADDPHQSSFFGEQSLTLSGLFRTNPATGDMGSSFSSNPNNNQNASSYKGNQSQRKPTGAQSLRASFAASMNASRLDASQPIREVEETDSEEESSSYYSSSSAETPFQDEFDPNRRKPLRMPKPKPPPDPAVLLGKKQQAQQLEEEMAALVEQRQVEYDAFFVKQDEGKYQHRKCGPFLGCLICLLLSTGVALGGYFFAKSIVNDLNEQDNVNTTTLAPTIETLVLPDYTQAALANPVSVQAQALVWLYNDPNYDTYTQTEKYTRFALMTIYAATGGESWQHPEGFVLPQSAWDAPSECDFPYYTCPTPGQGGAILLPPITVPPILNITATAPPIFVPGIPNNNNNNTNTIPPSANNGTDSSSTTFSPTTILPSLITNTLPPAAETLAPTIFNIGGPTNNNEPATIGPITNPDSNNITTTLAPTTIVDPVIDFPIIDPVINPIIPAPNETLVPSETTTIPPTAANSNNGSSLVENIVGGVIDAAIPFVNETAVDNGLPPLGDLRLGDLFTNTDPNTKSTTTITTNDPAGRQRRQLAGASYARGNTLNLTNQGILQGTLPPELALLTELQNVQISNNPGLIGTLPDTIRSWEDFLFQLVVTGNSIGGTLPTIMGQLTHVRTLHLNDNQFTGPLPEQLALLSQLRSLQLQNNQFSGTWPVALRQYPYVQYVNAASNRFTGPLPSFFVPGAEASQVRSIVLTNNTFNGTIPTELGGLSQLEILQLHSNFELQGSVPNEICQLPKLLQLTVDCLQIICGCQQCECPTGGRARLTNLTSILPAYSVSAMETDPTGAQSQAYQWLLNDPAVTSYSTEQQRQRFALATLFYATSVPANITNSWTTSTNWLSTGPGISNECAWASTVSVLYRIPNLATDGLANCFQDVNGGYDAYQSLRLANNNLIGSLPQEIALLTNLKVLELHNNTLAGPIPTTLNALTSLQVLDLESSGLTGTFPTQLTEFPVLTEMYVGTNSLNGTLPTELGRMTTVEVLQMNTNQFSGTIPTELALLSSNVQRLYLSTNKLEGSLPLGQLTSLVELYLADNELTGPLDSTGVPLTTAPALEHLVLSNNFLSGLLPSELGSMPAIRILLLDRNQFRGPIPSEIAGAAATLQWFDATSNLLTGSIPTELGLLTQLVDFHIGDTRMVGTIPTELVFLPALTSLSLETNRLSGTVPVELALSTSLSKIKIDHNDMVGTVPFQLSLLSSTLNWLEISWNALTGSIPTELALLTNLEWLYLERNNLNRAIPTELGQLTKLKELSLYGLQLTGTIPSELGLLSGLQTGLYLHENYIEGRIPSELGLLTTLQSLWLHVSSLTGSVPAELCALKQSGTLRTLAIDCNKVTCSCQCSCPTEGGDAPRTAGSARISESFAVPNSSFRDPPSKGYHQQTAEPSSRSRSVTATTTSLSNLFNH